LTASVKALSENQDHFHKFPREIHGSLICQIADCATTERVLRQ